MISYLDKIGLEYFWGKIKSKLSTKVDKVDGKGLSTNDYTTEEKNKLAGIAAGAEANVQPDWNATSGDAVILNKPTIPTKITQLTDGSSNNIDGILHADSISSSSLEQFYAHATPEHYLASIPAVRELINLDVTVDQIADSTFAGTKIKGTAVVTGTYNASTSSYEAPTWYVLYNLPAYNITPSDISNWNSKSNFSGSYNDLSDKPTIPTKTSELINDSGYITDKEKEYLSFVALESGTFGFTHSVDGAVLYYSKNDGEWTALTGTIDVVKGDVVRFKGELTPVTNKGIGTFTSTGDFDAEGNVMSLLFGDNFQDNTTLPEYAFFKLFFDTRICSAKNLVLPSLTLSRYCYKEMFYNCGSLIIAPKLPALELVDYCYDHMFLHCTKLSYVKALFCTTPSASYTSLWLGQVAEFGIFVRNSKATWYVRSATGIPSNWFDYYSTASTVSSLNSTVSNHTDQIHTLYDDVSTNHGDIVLLKRLVNGLNAAITPKNISSSAIMTNEKIGTARINKILIPIDPVANAYIDDTVISETEIVPYINTLTGENYLILKLGSIINSNHVITEAHIIGTGIYSTPDIRYIDSNMYIYPKLPLGTIKNNLLNLMLSYYNSNLSVLEYRIWFDDYPYEKFGYADLDEWTNDEFGVSWSQYVSAIVAKPDDSGYSNGRPNPYIFTGETFQWNGSEYYLWESEDGISEAYYILTNTVDYQELYQHSLEANPQNHWCPYVAKLTADKETYTLEGGTDDILVKVEQVTE